MIDILPIMPKYFTLSFVSLIIDQRFGKLP